jgi:hypothetical protein
MRALLIPLLLVACGSDKSAPPQAARDAAPAAPKLRDVTPAIDASLTRDAMPDVIRDLVVVGDTVIARARDRAGVYDANGARRARLVEARAVSDDGRWAATVETGASGTTTLVLTPLAGGEATKVDLGARRLAGLALSRDGSRYAYMTGDGTGTIAGGGAKPVTFEPPEPHYGLAFLDDATIAVFASADKWALFDATTGAAKGELDGSHTWLEDGWRVRNDGGTWTVARAADAKPTRTLPLGDLGVKRYLAAPVVDAAGATIAFVSAPYEGEAGKPEVLVYDLATGAPELRWPEVGGPLAFSADGKRLYVGAGPVIRVLDVERGVEIGAGPFKDEPAPDR